MLNFESEDIRGLCDPATSEVCWWDFYPLAASNRGCAVTAGGLRMAAFCNQACADAWATYEAPVRPADERFRFEASGCVCAPPRECAKKFGGSLSQEQMRGFALKPPGRAGGQAVRAVQTYALGTTSSDTLRMSFFCGEAREPFAVCDPRKSKICWWDNNFCNNGAVRAAVLYTPAKLQITKARYRFSESVAHDCEDRTRDENFLEYGCFCSHECRKAWTQHTFARDPQLVASALQLDEIRDVLAERPPVSARPAREALKLFGGFMTLAQFRDRALGAYESSMETIELPGSKVGFSIEIEVRS